LKKSSSFVLSGLVLVGAKLALWPFAAALATSSLFDLSDCGLTLLLAVAAWRASRRAHAVARAMWLGVVLASALWSISFGIGALMDAFAAPEAVLNAFWPTTIIGYFVFLALALPLLLKDEAGTIAIGWLQMLDVAQLGILTLSAYLVFFYIPSLHEASNQARSQNFMILHLVRGGFLAAGYLYRGWRSRLSGLRRLRFRFSVFFVTFGITASLYLHALNAWHWPQPWVNFVADLPVLFLLVTAVNWQQPGETMQPAPLPVRKQGMLWSQIVPLAIPLSVIALSSRISDAHSRVAWIAVTASFACYAVRLMVMQRRQDATVANLSAMEKKFSKAFHSSPVAMALTRVSDGRYVDANDRYLELLRRPRAEVIGKTTVEAGVFANLEARTKVVERILRHDSLRNVPFQISRPDRALDAVFSAELIKLEHDSLILSSVLDVTEIKSVTHQLQQAQKMELVGILAGGVAHDFNNLLTIIKGYSELARMRELKGELEQEIRQIGEAADKAAALTRQLLAFGRRQILQPRNLGLNSIVSGIEKMLQRTIGAHIKLVTFMAPDLGVVRADPVQMEQVVINLALNSRDAMPNGGKLVFQTENLELASPYVESGFRMPLGRYVVLAVSDTGTGILPQHRERVFEPFFTTKEAGHGTGLGLSTVYGIIKQSGGYISVYSEVGLGTTFKIYLPRVDKPVDTLKPETISTQNLNGTETILIAEDDPRVCELAAGILSQHGYKVLTANSAAEALRCASEFKGEVHLLLADIVMAAASGYELARKLKEMRPALKVLYMSGYPRYALSSRMNMNDFHESLLSKPFTPAELAHETRRTLDGENHLVAMADVTA
jgi:PAS domain S-box-containing protein